MLHKDTKFVPKSTTVGETFHRSASVLPAMSINDLKENYFKIKDLIFFFAYNLLSIMRNIRK